MQTYFRTFFNTFASENENSCFALKCMFGRYVSLFLNSNTCLIYWQKFFDFKKSILEFGNSGTDN